MSDDHVKSPVGHMCACCQLGWFPAPAKVDSWRPVSVLTWSGIDGAWKSLWICLLPSYLCSVVGVRRLLCCSACSLLVSADGVLMRTCVVQSRTNELHGPIKRNTFWWAGHFFYYGDGFAFTVPGLSSFRRDLYGSTRSNMYQGFPLDTELFQPTKFAPRRFLLPWDFRLIRGVNEEHDCVLLRLWWRSFDTTDCWDVSAGRRWTA